MRAPDIAAALGDARREGRRWRCRCPLHGGRSLVLHEGDNGRVLAEHGWLSSVSAGGVAHRERRQLGLRCVTIQLRETEIDVLIRGGMLNREMRNNRNAIIEALYKFLDRTLGA